MMSPVLGCAYQFVCVCVVITRCVTAEYRNSGILLPGLITHPGPSGQHQRDQPALPASGISSPSKRARPSVCPVPSCLCCSVGLAFSNLWPSSLQSGRQAGRAGQVTSSSHQQSTVSHVHS
uniref:Secreted peptide n=1 Tax=Anopheles braziliensis TaxID=58242 RepID=A0A2M3ZL97_9DIPT